MQEAIQAARIKIREVAGEKIEKQGLEVRSGFLQQSF
jgi:hypothetical protein